MITVRKWKMDNKLIKHLETVSTMFDTNILLPRDIAMNLLRRSLGDRFLMYLLNLSKEDELEKALEKIPLGRFNKLTLIMVLATPVLLENPDLSTVPGTFCRSFEKEISLLDEIRMQNGAVPYLVPVTGDELYNHLVKDAQQIFPTLLMTEWGNGLDTGNRFNRLENFFQDGQAEFEDLLCQEKCVKDLFHDCGKRPETPSSFEDLCISTTFLPVLPLSALSLKKAILSDAFYRANTLDVDNDRDVINKAIKESLHNFRTLLLHGTSKATCVTIFDAVRPLGSTSIDLDGSELRLATDYERQMLLPKALDCPLVYISKFDDELLGVGKTSKVFETIDANSFSNNFYKYKEDGESFSWAESVSNDLTVIRAAIILATEDAEYRTARLCGQCLFVPYGFVSSKLETGREDQAFLTKKRSTEVDLAEVKRWFLLLKVSKFSFGALRRLVIAFSERQNQEDAILDLLIVLESILGSSTETSFKLSLCISKLLNPTDKDARRNMFNQMKRAYDLRSRIIHGAKKNPKKHNEESTLNFLSEVAIKLIKVLLTDRNDLLSTKPDKRINAIALL